MKDFHLGPSSQAQWYGLVYDAGVLAGFQLEESMESYLVLTLDHYTTDISLASTILAIEFLSSTNKSTQSDAMKLRNVGDQCLILSGLFPDRAMRKHVSLDYFIQLGKGAYHSISHQESHPYDPELFYQLSLNFVGLMDILHHMRLLGKSALHHF